MDKLAQAGVSIEEMIDVLSNLVQNNDLGTKLMQIENLRSRVQSPAASDRLGQLIGALKVPDQLGQGMGVVDPQSGKPYPNTNNLIKEYIDELKEQKKMSNSSFNFLKFSQESSPKKKKTRGNPFRVLMGKVGKLLDHGLGKRDIVRYIVKEDKWNEETIEKAVNLVKDYNKKKHSKKTVESQTLPNPNNDWPRVDKDYSKRSNAELITSLGWLNSISKLDAKEVHDRSGVKTMMREIKSVLLDRGMSDSSLNDLLK